MVIVSHYHYEHRRSGLEFVAHYLDIISPIVLYYNFSTCTLVSPKSNIFILNPGTYFQFYFSQFQNIVICHKQSNKKTYETYYQ